MLNNQEYITSKLEEILYEILPISSKRLKNLVAIITGILLSKSVIIFDHTTLDDRFLILQFSLKVGKRTILLIVKVFINIQFITFPSIQNLVYKN